MGQLSFTKSDDTEAYHVTDEGNAAAMEAFVFSPGGKHIAFVSADEKLEEHKGENMKIWGKNWPYARVRIVNVETQNVTNPAN